MHNPAAQLGNTNHRIAIAIAMAIAVAVVIAVDALDETELILALFDTGEDRVVNA